MTTLFSVLLAGVLAGAYGLYDVRGDQDADRLLGAALDAAADEFGAGRPVQDLLTATEEHLGVSVIVYRADGSVWDAVGNVDLPRRGSDGLVLVQGQPVRRRSRSIDGATVVAGVPWASHMAQERLLAGILGTLWICLTLGVALLVRYSVRRTFVPLLEMAQQAERLSGERLGDRLPVVESGEFAELAQRLNALLDRLEEGNRRQRVFLAEAAHELRTPLTVLGGTIETTLLQPRSPEDYRAMLAALLEEVRRVARLVEAILVSSRSDQVSAGPIDLSSALLDEAERWAARLRERDIAIRMEIESVFCAILREEASCILDNLLANAAKHAPDGSAIFVTVRRQGDRVLLTVRDEGPGIPAALRDAIFEPFVRSDASPVGAGLGLALARRIVESRAGAIRLGEVVSGACLVVELPVATVPTGTGHRPVA
ncbi:MAG: HAMP domain-containing protein [Fimbriimonadaceae bacterium]|nr:HAMP domain-containing protein [Fimbriimonadaceae bacterium]